MPLISHKVQMTCGHAHSYFTNSRHPISHDFTAAVTWRDGSPDKIGMGLAITDNLLCCTCKKLYIVEAADYLLVYFCFFLFGDIDFISFLCASF